LFSLEEIAHHLTANMTKDSTMDTAQKAKIEYGLSLTLGVIIEFVLTVGASAFLGATVYTLVIMLSALVLRVFTGGSHCSSYRRCLVFTILIFVGLSLIAKIIAANTPFNGIIEMFLFPAIIGIAVQGFMLTGIGKKFVTASDRSMQRMKI
jgi:accessory gene regulator B